MTGEAAEESDSDSGPGPGGGGLGTAAVDVDEGLQDTEGSTPTGSGTATKPYSSYRLQVQEVLAREYKTMSLQLKVKQTEMKDLRDNLNCRINCLTIAEKQIILSFHKVKQLIKDNPAIYTILPENGNFDEKKEEKGEDSDSASFKLAIKHYGGSILENLTQQHFQRKLDDLSALFGDTLRKANDRIVEVETELRECQVITQQLIQIINVASQQQQSPQDNAILLDSVVVPPPSPLSPPTPPKTPNDVMGEMDDDDSQEDQQVPAASPVTSVPVVPPGTDSSADKDKSLDVLSDIVEQEQTAPCLNIINVRVKEDYLSTPISVPAYLTTLPPGSPPTDFHAWKIDNRPLHMNFFECGCRFRFITFSGLLNHLRKLKLITPLETSPPDSPASPPPFINLDDDAHANRRAKPPPPQSPPFSVVPSTSTPSSPEPPPSRPSPSNAIVPSPTTSLSSTPSTPPPQSSCSIVGDNTLIDFQKSDAGGDGGAVEKKRCTRTRNDPCPKVLFQCNAVTLLPSGKPCGKFFKSFWGMRRHKRAYHDMELHVDEWGCPICAQIFTDEKKFEWHKLYDNCSKRKKDDVDASEDEEIDDDGNGRGPCTLCKKVGTKSDKCEQMHFPRRRKLRKLSPVEAVVETFLEERRAKVENDKMMNVGGF